MLGFAFWLRTESSQLRHFHADEGVQSYQAWRLIESGEYRYDPSEHHGPLLYYLAKWMSPFLSDETGELTDAGMRRVPMLFSLTTLAIGLFAFRRYGVASAVLWGLIFASAPLSVIYGSYFVQEALLTCFSLALLLALYAYWHNPSWLWAIAVGLFLGLAHVTKETVVLHVGAICVAGVVVAWIRREGAKVQPLVLLKHVGAAALLVLVLHSVFFSSFFQNPRGIVDGIMTFFSYAERSQGEGHEKPFLYYFNLLLPHKREGVRWSELAFLVSVGIGIVCSLVKIKENGFSAFVILSGLVMLLMYSVIPYKNPWLLLTPYSLLAYGASAGVIYCFEKRGLAWFNPARFQMWILGLILLLWLGSELRSNLGKGVFRYASASRNPYLYMHTTPRYGKLLDRLESIQGKSEIAIYSPDAAWPLPWHLRSWERVGYWTDLETYKAGGIDVVDTRLLVGQEEVVNDGAFWELNGLRPNTLLALRASDEIAEEWINANAKD